MKDHDIQKIVNQLRDVAIQYGHTQQIRGRIHSVIVPRIKELNKSKDDTCLLCEASTDANSWQEECSDLRSVIQGAAEFCSWIHDFPGVDREVKSQAKINCRQLLRIIK